MRTVGGLSRARVGLWRAYHSITEHNLSLRAIAVVWRDGVGLLKVGESHGRR